MREIKNNCVGGSCSRCGECCTGFSLPLAKVEAHELWLYVKSRNIQRLNRGWLADVEVGRPLSSVDIRCCFYDSVARCCTVYDVRPQVCRGFCCSLSEEEVEKRKASAHDAAYFNSGSVGKGDATSFDALFYGDFDFLPLALFIYTKMKSGVPCTYEQVFRLCNQVNFTLHKKKI